MMKRALIVLALVLSSIVFGALEVYAIGSPDALAQKMAEDASSLVNQYRESKGLHPLARVSSLDRAASAKAQSLVLNGRFTHRDEVIHGVEYFTNGARYRLHNYRLLGENLACGPLLMKPEQISSAWINSKIHVENILHSTFSEYGIGIVRGNVNYNNCKSSEDLVLVMVFGGVM